MSLLFTAAVASTGAFVWSLRLRPLASRRRPPGPAPSLPAVSVIVPARNEAHNLPALLDSLARLDPAPREVIVVDDHSTDGTGELARGRGCRVVPAPPLPPGWNGKPWACHHGARVATGELLLFTDADVVHGPASLGQAAAALRESDADLVSLVAEHRVASAWESLQGPFHLLLLVAGRAAAGPARQVYANGQYLLVRRDAYRRIGGHAAARDAIAEDLELATRVEESGGASVSLSLPGALTARMYPEGPAAMIAGWRRSFRDGLRAAGLVGALEVTFVFAWLLGLPLELAGALAGGDLAVAGPLAAGWAATVVEVARRQRLVGAYPRWSALLHPLAVAAFALVTALATVDWLLRRPVHWKGRRLEGPQK